MRPRAAEERDGPELEVLRHVVHDWESVEPWVRYEELFRSDLHAATFRVLMAHPTVQEAIDAADPGVADLIGRLATEEMQTERRSTPSCACSPSGRAARWPSSRSRRRATTPSRCSSRSPG